MRSYDSNVFFFASSLITLLLVPQCALCFDQLYTVLKQNLSLIKVKRNIEY